MSKYTLVVKYEDGKNVEIPFEKLFQSLNLDPHDLRNIDYFTSYHKDKYELMHTLLFYGLVKERNVKKILKIEYKFDHIIKEALIIYKNDLKFMNIEYLTKYMLSKYNDPKFLKFLYELYKDNPVQKKNIEIFGTFINKYYYEFYSKYGFDMKNDLKNNINSLNDFIQRQIYKYDTKTKKYVQNIDGTYELSYKQYRDFAKVISNYSKKNDTLEDIELFEKTHFENQKIHENLRKLIKTKKTN